VKKTPKKLNHKRPSVQHPETKQRKQVQNKKDKHVARAPWLKILSEDIDEDHAQDGGRNPLTGRNGRREHRDNSLYLAERNSRSGRIVR
jgi:hypothetical protein